MRPDRARSPQKAESRKQKAESRKQKAESRKQKAGPEGLPSAYCLLPSEAPDRARRLRRVHRRPWILILYRKLRLYRETQRVQAELARRGLTGREDA